MLAFKLNEIQVLFECQYKTSQSCRKQNESRLTKLLHRKSVICLITQIIELATWIGLIISSLHHRNICLCKCCKQSVYSWSIERSYGFLGAVATKPLIVLPSSPSYDGLDSSNSTKRHLQSTSIRLISTDIEKESTVVCGLRVEHARNWNWNWKLKLCIDRLHRCGSMPFVICTRRAFEWFATSGEKNKVQKLDDS